MLRGETKITIITKIDGKKIKNNLNNVSLKDDNLFLFINTTAKNGANKIICSQIKHKIGKKIKTIELTKFE